MLYTPYIWPLLLGAAILTGIGLYARRFKGAPAINPFILIMWIGVLWALLYALNLSAISLSLKIFFFQLQFIPIAFSAPTILALALQYTQRGAWLTRRRLVLLLAIPVLSIPLALTGNYQTLFRYDYSLGGSDPLPVLLFSRGPLFWVYYLGAFHLG